MKLFKAWINERDLNSVAVALRKVGIDNRLMVSRKDGLTANTFLLLAPLNSGNG